METTRKKKNMADSRFRNFNGLIFPKKKSCLQISACSTMHENTKKTGQISFSVTENRTCELPQFLRDFDDYAIM